MVVNTKTRNAKINEKTGSRCIAQSCDAMLRKLIRKQPRSQGPFSTSRKYFLEVERGPWERG